mmetsp:Transcript_46136/g.88038  ORF Transcript_46136/g.88038 Transcript_46136/m.88038 type:complete len:86 (-) Transcript_46136:668-925(-)
MRGLGSSVIHQGFHAHASLLQKHSHFKKADLLLDYRNTYIHEDSDSKIMFDVPLCLDLQSVDLNVVLDKLMNGEGQAKKTGWFGR